MGVGGVDGVGEPSGEAGAQPRLGELCPGGVPERPVDALDPGVRGIPGQLDGEQLEAPVGGRHRRGDPRRLGAVRDQERRCVAFPGHGHPALGQLRRLGLDPLLVGDPEGLAVGPGDQHRHRGGVRVQPEPLLGDPQRGGRVVAAGQEVPGLVLGHPGHQGRGQASQCDTEHHPQGDDLPGVSGRVPGQGADHGVLRRTDASAGVSAGCSRPASRPSLRGGGGRRGGGGSGPGPWAPSPVGDQDPGPGSGP